MSIPRSVQCLAPIPLASPAGARLLPLRHLDGRITLFIGHGKPLRHNATEPTSWITLDPAGIQQLRSALAIPEPMLVPTPRRIPA